MSKADICYAVFFAHESLFFDATSCVVNSDDVVVASCDEEVFGSMK